MILSRWEKMPEEEAKCMIMDNVIEKFILLYILERNWSSEDLISELRTLVEGNEFSISSDLDNRNNIVQLYLKFNILFFKKEITTEEAEDKINQKDELIQEMIVYGKHKNLSFLHLLQDINFR